MHQEARYQFSTKMAYVVPHVFSIPPLSHLNAQTSKNTKSKYIFNASSSVSKSKVKLNSYD